MRLVSCAVIAFGIGRGDGFLNPTTASARHAACLSSGMRILLSLILLLTVSTAFAEFEPLDNIKAAAIGAVSHGEADTTAQVTLDPNLQMPKCGEALQANGGQRGVSEVS